MNRLQRISDPQLTGEIVQDTPMVIGVGIIISVALIVGRIYARWEQQHNIMKEPDETLQKERLEVENARLEKILAETFEIETEDNDSQ